MKQLKEELRKKMAKHAVFKSNLLKDINTLISEYKITSKYQKKVLECILDCLIVTISDLAKMLNLTYSQVYSSAKALERRA